MMARVDDENTQKTTTTPLCINPSLNYLATPPRSVGIDSKPSMYKSIPELLGDTSLIIPEG